MEEVLNVILWAINIAIGGLLTVGVLFVFFLIFKFLCTIHAEIVAEKIKSVLEELKEDRTNK